MRYGSKSSGKLLAALAALYSLSACAHNEERPKPVSDTLCLNDRPLSVSVAPGVDVDDPGNQFDTEDTVLAVFSHNAVFHSLC